MKCLIYCHERGTDWIKQYFSDATPYMVRIGNKPLLEFYIEFCVLNKVKDVFIIKESGSSSEIEDYCGNGSKWDINITYLSLGKEHALNKIICTREKLFSNDSLLIFNGFFFLQYKKSHINEDFLPQQGSWQNLTDTGQGLMFLNRSYYSLSMLDDGDGKDLKHFDGKHIVNARKLDSLKAYYDLNMEMVKGAARDYIMPSYSNENGVFIGQNVEIPFNSNVEKPIILGDNIHFKRGTEIGPGAIIGSNSLVDTETSIKDSVIYRDTYIGAKLEIANKIIYKRRLIDPENGAVIDIVDDFLLAEVHNDLISIFANWVIEMLLLILLFVIQLPFFILLRPFVGAYYNKELFWTDKSGTRKMFVSTFTRKTASKANKLFIKLSLHKFHLLPFCFTRKLRLVGASPRYANGKALQNIRELSEYHPAIFPYSDLYTNKGDEASRQVNEMFYAENSSLQMNVAIFFKTLIYNFFGTVNGKK